MQNTIAKDKLRDYVKRNEVVFQAFGDLMEVANEAEKKNKEDLLTYLDDASSVEVYAKGHWYVKEEFAELDGWATGDDVLFLFSKLKAAACICVNHSQTNYSHHP